MALRLHLVSKQAADLGEAATAVFGVHGGRLGRAPDNDWCLPDEHRYLSGHHAHIVHRAGEWSVLDTSSNGVWHNRERTPIGRGNLRKLAHGDRLRFGDYVAMVSIVGENDFSLEADVIGRRPVGLDVQLAHATENHLGVDFDIHSLLDGSGAFAIGPTPRPRAQRPLLVPPPGRPVTEPMAAELPLAPANPAPPPTADQFALQSRLAGLQLPASSTAPAVSPTTLPVGQTAVAALGRGLGIELGRLSAAEQSQLFVVAGQLLREFTLGLMGQLRLERARIQRLGATAELTARNPNPLEALESTNEALHRLLVEPAQRFMGPVDAVRDAFEDLVEGQQRHDAAVQAGLDHLLTQLQPAELAARFDRALGPQGAAGDASRYWAMYPDLYRSITQARTDRLPYVFTEGYSRARDEAVRRAEEATGAITDVNGTLNRPAGLAG